jgi:hypothetical protein
MRRVSYSYIKVGLSLGKLFIVGCSEKLDLTNIALHKIETDANLAITTTTRYEFNSNFFYLCYDI